MSSIGGNGLAMVRSLLKHKLLNYDKAAMHYEPLLYTDIIKILGRQKNDKKRN